MADNMLHEMYGLMIANNADIVVCNHFIVDLNDEIKKSTNISVDKLINRIDATSLILMDRVIYSFAWDKLYKRKLFEGIEYPKKRIIEDLATTYKFINKADNIFLTSNAFYYYVRRENSSCLNPDPAVTIRRKLDYFNGFYERHEFTQANTEYASIKFDCQAKAFIQGQQLLHFVIKNKLKKSNYSFEEIYTKISKMKILNNNELSSAHKFEQQLMKVSMRFYLFMISTYYSFKLRVKF